MKAISKPAAGLALAMTLALTLVGAAIAPTAHAAPSQKTQGVYMTKAMKAWKRYDIRTYKKYMKKLPKYASEPSTKKMSKKMKKVYRNKVKSFMKTKCNGTKNQLDAFYLSDINNDKKAELIVKVGTCEANYRFKIYAYKKGKAKKLGTVGAGHSGPLAYPNHKGFFSAGAHMDYAWLYSVKLNSKGLAAKNCGSYRFTKAYPPTRCMLKAHYAYDNSSWGELK